MRILYVENHAVFAKSVISQFLSAHEVAVVPGLSQARQAYLTSDYDLMLVDYDLDDGKGAELVREVRKLKPAFPIIGVSSHEQGNHAMLQAGADAICDKMNFDRIEQIIFGITKER